MDDIAKFMENQCDPRRFVVRERFTFWSDMQRKPGETVQELAARIRQEAATCDFASIKDPQDEALRTRFICTVGNEAVLKPLFKIKDDELTFSRAVHVALETEDAANVAKETVYGTKPKTVFKVDEQRLAKASRTKRNEPSAGPKPVPNVKCWRCGNSEHRPAQCRFKDSKCNLCEHIGHIAVACLKKKKARDNVAQSREKPIRKARRLEDLDPITQPLRLNGKHFEFELDTGTRDNFCSRDVWRQLGKPTLYEPHSRYLSATRGQLQILGTFNTKATILGQHHGDVELELNVTSLPQFNVLGRKTIRSFDIDVRALLKGNPPTVANVHAIRPNNELDLALQKSCKGLCSNFPDLFKPELGCLKDFELEISFKTDAKPIFCRPRTVPFAILEDLNQAYDAGIKRGI
ncbi:hypothetical protein M513_11311 [Trichuris suis]|uniref:Peptidase A2 domain-containing protein n=1 Tax=Trichuris suis TaxID=68888 RepID=A0A085LS85_9BILA|nr:hypothetical protein M513_11311 [Trichuris suis]